ncbi:hypothetical protein [Marinobacter caseinilyticus]|uniref:hypothetical protein n=1 Tax=Marinobacter caseinilyticus TaxID=2692195 RepID=UPI00140A8CE2|nr:hypothetical protein [Marinobacter caseinilyticus]
MSTHTEKIEHQYRWLSISMAVSLILGVCLFVVNLYGLSQPIRKPGLGVTDLEQLRFVPKEVWSYSESMHAIDALAKIDSKKELAESATQVINRSLVHIDWERVNASDYRQLVPFWENYFLWAVGQFSGLSQFQRYHFADYRRSIRRGVGICGDASIALSSVMDRYNVPNRIVSFDGHVIVEYERDNGARFLVDPDFGVSLGTSLQNLKANTGQVKARYLASGYTEREVDYLFEAYNSSFTLFEDTYHFMTLRYLFEYVSYVMKWLLPLVLVLVPVIWALRSGRRKNF